MAVNFTRIWDGLQVKPRTTTAANTKGEVEVIDSTGKLQYHNGTTVSPVVTESHTATLSNKDHVAGSTKVVDGSDATKKVAFDVAGATTSTTATLDFNQTANSTYTFPDGSMEVVGTTNTQTLSGKTLTSPILNTPTADTITGIAGGDLIVQSASNEDLIIRAQGSGIISLEDFTVDANTITGGASTATIQSATNQDLSLQAQGTGSVQVESVDFDGNTVTGGASTLTIQSASNQDLSLQAQGSGKVSLEALEASGSTLQAATNVDVNINAQGTGVIALQDDGTSIATVDTNGVNVRSAKEVRLNNSGNTFYTGLKAGANAANYTITLPAAAPGTNTALTYDGANYVWASGGGGGGSGDGFTQTLDTYVATIQAAQAITDREVVSINIHNGSGANLYKIFKADNNDYSRRTLFGISKQTVSVTQGSYNLSINQAFVASNVITAGINGRLYTTTYASSSDATLQALATLIATDPDVASATVTVVGGNQTGVDDRDIVILTSSGVNAITGAVEITFSNLAVTGGASQPTLSASTNTAPVQANIDVCTFGPLNGFTGLTPGAFQYLSNTAGALTETQPSADALVVGIAISSSVIFVDITQAYIGKFGAGANWYKVCGGTNASAESGPSATSEVYNFTSWATSATAYPGTAFVHTNYCGNGYNGGLMLVDYATATSNSVVADARRFVPGSGWSTFTQRGTNLTNGTALQLGPSLYVNKGSAQGSTTSSSTSRSDKWNGSSWSNLSNWGGDAINSGAFIASSVLYSFGGRNSGAAHQTLVETMNASETKSTGTSLPNGGGINGSNSAGAAAAQGMAGHGGANGGATTNSYLWNGSSWTTITMNVSSSGNQSGHTGYQPTAASTWVGASGNGTSVTNTIEKYNNISWSTQGSAITSTFNALGGIL